MITFDFKDLTLREQVVWTYDWFEDRTFAGEYEMHSTKSLPADLVALNKSFYVLILEHYISCHDKRINYIKKTEQDVMKFLKQNEVKTVQELNGPMLTLFKLQVLK